MKALFIVHDQSPIYGAGRSVGNLIRKLDMDVDLIFPLNLTRKITDEQIRTYFGPRVGRVWFLPQPAQLSCIDAVYEPIHHIKSMVKRFLYTLCQPLYHRIYKRGGYDFIHLNSIILYPMLKRKQPMFLHVREIASKQLKWRDRRAARDLSKAHGLICISQECADACPKAEAPMLVLKNPFDQTTLATLDEKAERERFGLSEDTTVFAIIGNVDTRKGVDRVIRAFLKADPKKSALLIVGRDPNNDGHEELMRREAGGDERIHFVGELENTDGLYRITDCVIRGDGVPGAGRTVFEGLYSGTGCILPGEREKHLPALELDDATASRVSFYPPKDEDALAQCIAQLDGHKVTQRSYFSNTDAYCRQFLAFVEANKA